MTTTTTILVAGDEGRNQSLLGSRFAAAGYEYMPASHGAEALRLIATRSPDVVVLDVRLPDMDGKELIRKVRGWSKVPIIVLSEHSDAAEEIASLDVGADDYLGKPFDPEGLMARIRKALRHRVHSEGELTILSSGGLVVDTLARIATREREPIRLTAREFDVLLFLMRHAGRVVTHRQILEAVWDSAHGGHTQYLRVFVGRLRQKIEDDPNDPKLLLTIQGIGYRLVAPS